MGEKKTLFPGMSGKQESGPVQAKAEPGREQQTGAQLMAGMGNRDTLARMGTETAQAGLDTSRFLRIVDESPDTVDQQQPQRRSLVSHRFFLPRSDSA